MLKTGATFSCQKHNLNHIYEKASYNTDQVILGEKISTNKGGKPFGGRYLIFKVVDGEESISYL